MNNAVLILLLCATITRLSASELTTVDEPEVVDTQKTAIVKSVGNALSLKKGKRIFSRDGVKVAALITITKSIKDEPPEVKKSIQFFIDNDNWVEISLSDSRWVTSHCLAEMQISATNDSITVTAPQKGYCEIFFRSTGTFLDGATRDNVAPSFMSTRLLPQ